MDEERSARQLRPIAEVVGIADLNDRLVAAVLAEDAEEVWSCVRAGAEPDAPGPDGLPLLCAAVAGHDSESARWLVDYGADPDRVLPDGTTPLLRAVDSGSPAMVGTLTGKDPAIRIAPAEQERLLGLARNWCTVGAVETLRRRTGARGPAVRRTVTEQFVDLDEVSLGGLTVREGHSGVLTGLERALGILTPAAELVARAVAYPAELHANWSAASFTLGRRRSPRAWSELAALRHHPDPVHRRFLADVLGSRETSLVFGERPDVTPDADFLVAWALDEPDGDVLGRILEVLAEKDHPDVRSVGLRYVAHPHPGVRYEVVSCLLPWEGPLGEAATAALVALSRDPVVTVRAGVAWKLDSHGRELAPAFRDVLLALLQDTDDVVRHRAAASLAGSEDCAPAVMDALLALLDEEDRDLRLEAAYGLAVRDHPRTEEAYERVGPGPYVEHDHRPDALWRYRMRNRSEEG
ncbi:HEAT repeat domain-containing protein [Kitasatospora sp. NPDC059408]|uniref:HEAT repeat domain-containing protein n=1 Tax=Kitasatospora sp. NPDC059408 TaxID=3346823 RepID=UPI00369771DD